MDETLPPNSLLPTPRASRDSSAEAAGFRELDLAPGESIGPYRVVERLGTGGMGIVYKCRDNALDRFVAVKVIRRKYAADEHCRLRFQREAQTVAHLSHPSIAHVYGIGESCHGGESLMYIAMEFVDGPSVETILQRETRLPLDVAVRMAREVALGLREAQQMKIVHRDIKPSNILVSPGQGVKIVDFGLAKELGGQNSMTDEGIVLGTPHYLSPEQGRGHAVDHRSDIYSLGATLYHMLTGRPPFEGDSQVSVIVAHVNDAPVPPHEVEEEIPLSVSRVVCRMLAKSPGSRYPDYDALLRDLEAVRDRREPPGASSAGLCLPPGDQATVRLPAPARRRSSLMIRKRKALWIPVVAVLLAAAGAAGIWAVGSPAGDRSVQLRWLGTWYERLPDGRDLLDMRLDGPRSAATMPQEATAAEKVSRLLRHPEGAGESQRPPYIAGGAVHWDGFSRPVVCSLAFEQVNEIRIFIGPTKGFFDLAVGLVDRYGPQRRRLLFRIRPMEKTPQPLLALRNNQTIAVRSSAGGDPPLVPRLGPGPFEISLGLAAAATSTIVNVRVTRRRSPRFSYEASLAVEGTDWASGLLWVETPSPIEPFSVTLERVQVSGLLAPQPDVEVTSWQS